MIESSFLPMGFHGALSGLRAASRLRRAGVSVAPSSMSNLYGAAPDMDAPRTCHAHANRAAP
jgi:hypothetical protein